MHTHIQIIQHICMYVYRPIWYDHFKKYDLSPARSKHRRDTVYIRCVLSITRRNCVALKSLLCVYLSRWDRAYVNQISFTSKSLFLTPRTDLDPSIFHSADGKFRYISMSICNIIAISILINFSIARNICMSCTLFHSQ